MPSKIFCVFIESVNSNQDLSPFDYISFPKLCQLCLCRMKNSGLETLQCSLIPNIICVLYAGDLLILCRVGRQLFVFHGERCDQECCHLSASPVPRDDGREQGWGKCQLCFIPQWGCCGEIFWECNQKHVFLSILSASGLHLPVVSGEWGSCRGG